MKSGSFSSYRAALSGTGADIGGERDDDEYLYAAEIARDNWLAEQAEAAMLEHERTFVGPPKPPDPEIPF